MIWNESVRKSQNILTNANSGVTDVYSDELQSKHPIVSVIMLAYNHEKYLEKAVESVVNQETSFPFELIIGEDCSSDTTRMIALSLQRKYAGVVRVVFSLNNVGLNRNCERLIVLARGEYVAFCEGDDYWHNPMKLHCQVKFLQRNPKFGLTHSDFDYLLFFYRKWRRIRNYNKTRNIVIPQGDICSTLLEDNLVQTCTMMCRTDLVKQYFNSRLNLSSLGYPDWSLILYASKFTKISYMDVSLASYRRTPGSMMNTGPKNKLNYIKGIQNMYKSFALEFGVSDTDWLMMQRRYYRSLFNIAINARSENDYFEATEWLRQHDKQYLKRPKTLVKQLSRIIPLCLGTTQWIIRLMGNARLLIILVRQRMRK